MLLRMLISGHPGRILVVLGSLLRAGVRDLWFRWQQVSLPPSWHDGNRTLLGCHLFVADRKPAVTSEEFMLKYLGISNVKTVLIRYWEVGGNRLCGVFSLLLISEDSCLGSTVSIPKTTVFSSHEVSPVLY